MIDIVQGLIDQPDYQTARKYWNKLKGRPAKEGSQSDTNCIRLKLKRSQPFIPIVTGWTGHVNW